MEEYLAEQAHRKFGNDFAKIVVIFGVHHVILIITRIIF